MCQCMYHLKKHCQKDVQPQFYLLYNLKQGKKSRQEGSREEEADHHHQGDKEKSRKGVYIEPRPKSDYFLAAAAHDDETKEEDETYGNK